MRTDEFEFPNGAFCRSDARYREVSIARLHIRTSDDNTVVCHHATLGDPSWSPPNLVYIGIKRSQAGGYRIPYATTEKTTSQP